MSSRCVNCHFRVSQISVNKYMALFWNQVFEITLKGCNVMSTCANVRPLCKPENSVKRKVGPKGSHVALLKTAECFHGSQNFRERSSILGPFSVNCNFFFWFPTNGNCVVSASERNFPWNAEKIWRVKRSKRSCTFFHELVNDNLFVEVSRLIYISNF